MWKKKLKIIIQSFRPLSIFFTKKLNEISKKIKVLKNTREMHTSDAGNWYTHSPYVCCWAFERVKKWENLSKITGDESEKCMAYKSFRKKSRGWVANELLLVHTHMRKETTGGKLSCANVFFFIILALAMS